MPDFESQVREILDATIDVFSTRKYQYRADAVKYIVAAHTSSLAYIIGEDEPVKAAHEIEDKPDYHVNNLVPNLRNELRAEQRKRAGL